MEQLLRVDFVYSNNRPFRISTLETCFPQNVHNRWNENYKLENVLGSMTIQGGEEDWIYREL